MKKPRKLNPGTGIFVHVYGGNSMHDKHRIFSNGVVMEIIKTDAKNAADWVLCRDDDKNEGTVIEYWFLREQTIRIWRTP